MKVRILVVLMCLGLALAGCSGNGAKQLFETAQLEELQNNQEHARKLYEEIIREYPQSEFAKKAQERLPLLKER